MILRTLDSAPPGFEPGEGMAVDLSAQLGIGDPNVVPPGYFILNLTQDTDGEILVLTGRCNITGPNGKVFRMKQK